MRIIHKIPEGAAACGIVATPQPGAFMVMPGDDEGKPHTFRVHYRGQHNIPAYRQMYGVSALGLDHPSFRLAAVDDIATMSGMVYDLPNTHGDGGICFGGVTYPKSLMGFDSRFWASPFNTDLSGGRFPGWHSAGPATPEGVWRAHYKRLQERPSLAGVEQDVGQWDGPRVAKWSPRARGMVYFDSVYAQNVFGLDDDYASNTLGYAATTLADQAASLFPDGHRPIHYLRVRSRNSRRQAQRDLTGWRGKWLTGYRSLDRDTRRKVLLLQSKAERCRELAKRGNSLLKSIHDTSKELGIRRGAGRMRPTPKLRKADAEIRAFFDDLAEASPYLADIQRQWYEWHAKFHVATGKVRAKRTELRLAWEAAGGAENDPRARRRDRIGEYLSTGWRRGRAGAPAGAAAVMGMQAFYTGPATSAVFLSNSPEDLAVVPPEYQTVPQGKSGAFVGAFAAKHGSEYILAFPSRTKGLADVWRARCNLDGTGLSAFDSDASASTSGR